MDNDEKNPQYWDGGKNKTIRYWFYVKQGISVLNEVRNLFFIILGSCFTFKEQFPILKNLWFVSGILLVSFFVLGIVGFIFTHHVNKVVDWLNIQYATHWSRYTYDLMEKQITLLDSINKRLKSG